MKKHQWRHNADSGQWEKVEPTIELPDTATPHAFQDQSDGTGSWAVTLHEIQTLPEVTA